MKFISWNVNGLRAVFTKGFPDIIKELDADFVCLQETKMQAARLHQLLELCREERLFWYRYLYPS